jgi:serine/threonine protein kinase
VDDNWRTKLGDFGTGKLVSALGHEVETVFCELPEGFSGRGVTMTAAMGSWLWMAPELLGGQRVSTLNATSLDVYRWVLDCLIAVFRLHLCPHLPSWGNSTSLTRAPPCPMGSSFAITLWEIWIRQEPWHEIVIDDAHFFGELRTRVLDGHRPSVSRKSERAPVGYRELMQDCWATGPTHRPDAETIVSTLATMVCPRASSYEAQP